MMLIYNRLAVAIATIIKTISDQRVEITKWRPLTDLPSTMPLAMTKYIIPKFNGVASA